jgi:DNA replication protein DnaC
MKLLAEGRERLAELGLEHAAAILQDNLQTATREKRDYMTFLLVLLNHERSQRQQRNLEVRTKLAHLPYRKTLEEFDFSFQPSIEEYNAPIG